MIKSLIYILNILYILTFTCLFSCDMNKSLSNRDKSITEDSSVKKFSIIISFFSPGNGIDYRTKKKLVNFLNSNYPEIKYEKINWGKEGEVDFCFKLIELKKNRKSEFLNLINEITSISNRVKTYKNTTYIHQ